MKIMILPSSRVISYPNNGTIMFQNVFPEVCIFVCIFYVYIIHSYISSLENTNDPLWNKSVFDISLENKQANERKDKTGTHIRIPTQVMSKETPRIIYSQKPAEYLPGTHTDLSCIPPCDDIPFGMFTDDLHIIILYIYFLRPVF